MLKIFIYLCLFALRAAEISQKKLNLSFIKSVNHNNLESAKILLKKGADINCANKRGDRPITLAIENQNYALVNELLDYGANVDAVDGNNRTPLMLSMESQTSGSRAIFDRVLVGCPNLAIVDLDGNTALTNAVEAKDCYYLKKLLSSFDHAYLAAIKDKNGQNLTDLVLQEDNFSKTKLLCNYPIFKNQVSRILISKITNVALHDCTKSSQLIAELAYGLNKFPEFEENRKKRRIEPEHSYYI
jgi:ankyrin repeat protein